MLRTALPARSRMRWQHLWDVVAEQLEAAGDGWAEQVAIAIVTFLAALELDPPRAWMAVMEPLYGNRRARAARQVVVDRFVALLAAGPADEGGDRVPANTAAGTIGGLWELALQRVSGGEDAVGIDEAAGSAIFLALSPFVGRHEAMRHAFGVRSPPSWSPRCARPAATSARSRSTPTSPR